MSAERHPTLLLADDDAIFRSRLSRALSERGYEVRQAGDVDQAIASAKADSPEFAVVDLRMPGRSGLELVRALKEIDPATTVVVLTGYGSIATALEAVHLGAANYLSKPADADDVQRALGQSGGAPDSDSVPSLARVEWEHINRVLRDCHGNVSKASRLLGIHRRSLQRKLAKYPAPR